MVMGRLHIVIDDEVENELREILRYKRGLMSRFIEFSIVKMLERIKSGEIRIDKIIKSKI